jgi:MFS transporter, SP family, solute carrier family 2 (myo-inositol transporter), member 13
MFEKSSLNLKKFKVLKRIYNGDEEWIDYEMEEIKFSYDQQMKAKLEYGIDGFVIGRVLTTPHVRKALLIGCALQAFQQLCGINTVM